MTKISKMPVSGTRKNEQSLNFKNYSAQVLLEISRGITKLIEVFVEDDRTSVSDEENGNICRLLIFQNDISKEIASRIPFEFLEMIPNEGDDK